MSATRPEYPSMATLEFQRFVAQLVYWHSLLERALGRNVGQHDVMAAIWDELLPHVLVDIALVRRISEEKRR